MKSTSDSFKNNTQRALLDTQLQSALEKASEGFIKKRRNALDALPEYEQLRIAARKIKDHTLDQLDHYLARFEQQLSTTGGQTHWARSAEEASRIIVELCRNADAKLICKSKSMLSEEIALNAALDAAGFNTIETDLGEYIIQLAKEPPSHIIAPAVHKNKEQIADLFKVHHTKYGFSKPLKTIPAIVNEAREILRKDFVNADIGITGANFLIAETGSIVLVTNEGNGDLSATLPDTHIVIASIEKVIPSLEDASVLLRLLARSATGQEITAYTSFFSGPRRNNDRDGPRNFHVVLVDNGRSDMLGNDFRDMLLCIRCGACLNHCPVYAAVGGHAYGWVYPGPMGAVLTPLMTGLENSHDLPNASTLCGRCEAVCPLSIPLPQLLRQHRNRAHTLKVTSKRSRLGLALWAALVQRPNLYRLLLSPVIKLLSLIKRGRGRFSYLPFAGAWTRSRDFPAPQGTTFLAAWQRQQNNKHRIKRKKQQGKTHE